MTCRIINRPPQPALLSLGLDKTPHFIHFFPSQSSARQRRTIVWVGSSAANTASFTALNRRLFFKRFHHSGRANAEYSCGVSDATAIDCHLTNLVLHL